MVQVREVKFKESVDLLLEAADELGVVAVVEKCAKGFRVSIVL